MSSHHTGLVYACHFPSQTQKLIAIRMADNTSPDDDRRELARARAKQAIPQWLRERVFERDGGKCVNCQSEVGLEVDHVHPESKGGTLAFDNLQTLCKPCNVRKGAR